MRPSSMTPGHARAARIAYVAVILVATLSNLHPDWVVADAGPRLARAFHFAPHLSDAIDAARNVLLFAGLGGVWVATSRLSRPGATLVRLTVISLVFSAAIETLQLFSPVREASIIDVTTDTIGGLAGGLFTLGAFALIDERNRKRSFLGVPALVFAVGYSVATLAEVFFPLFRQDLLPNLGGSVTDRIGRAILAIRPGSIAQVALTDVLIFAPAGAFTVWALAEAGLGPGTGAVLAALLAAILYPATEVAHGVVGVPIVTGAIATHVAAATLGALVAAATFRRFAGMPTRSRARLVASGYAAVIAIWSWRPFRLDLSPVSMAQQFSSDHVVPLQALASRGDLFSVTDVIAQGLLFVPLGALVAVWPLRRRGALRGLLPTVYLAILLEAGKIPIAQRFMDVTHILIQCAGAAIGFLLVRRVGFAVRGELLDADSGAASS